MIVIRLIGGLGNQMFQYALGLALSKKNNSEIHFDLSRLEEDPLRRYMLDDFGITEKELTKAEVREFQNPSGISKKISRRVGIERFTSVKRLAESEQEFEPDILNLSGDVLLHGYWQTEKYFLNVADKVRSRFSFRLIPSKEDQEVLDKIDAANIAICLHVRRADYIDNPKFFAEHGVPPMDYYDRAIKMILEKYPESSFFIFSDDPGWAKENISIEGSEVTYVDHNDIDHGPNDMMLMSKCDHFIIANSSFSWWGAWLGANEDKVVIAPSKWFANKDRSNADIIPESWIKLDVS